MEINFFTIWFIISPFVILHLYLKNKNTKEKVNQVMDHINSTWDSEYKKILLQYGTIDNFIKCHKEDFDIIRSNMTSFYEQISDINRDYMAQTEKLLNNVDDTSDVGIAIKLIRKNICMRTDDLLTMMNSFIYSEEQAHSSDNTIVDILNKIDDKYKNNSIYKEINKD